MLSMLFGVIGRHFWPVTIFVGVAALVSAATGYYQAMAILGSTFGGLLMWEAERHDERPAEFAALAEAAE